MCGQIRGQTNSPLLQDLGTPHQDHRRGIGSADYPGRLDLVVHFAAHAKVHELVEHPNRVKAIAWLLWQTIADYIGKALGVTPEIHIQPTRKGEITRYVANVGKARAVLDYHPTTALNLGIQKSVAWCLDWWSKKGHEAYDASRAQWTAG